MTRKRWLELYDELNAIDCESQFQDIPAWLIKLLIELKPPTEIKHTETHYADEPPF